MRWSTRSRERAADALRALAEPGPNAVALGAATFVLSTGAVVARAPGEPLAAFWPAAGVSVAWVLLHDRDRWRSLVLAIGVGAFLANLLGGRSLEVSAWFGLANAIEILTVAAWMSRGRVAKARLHQFKDVARLLAATTGGALAAGFLIGGGLWALEGQEFASSWRHVSANHAAAVLLLVPPALLWRDEGRAPAGRYEQAGQWILTLVATVVVFWPLQALPLSFLPIPALVWTAVRSGPRTTALQLAASSLVVALCTQQDRGPFALATTGDAGFSAPLVQLFVVAYGTGMLVLCVTVQWRTTQSGVVAQREQLYRSGFDQAMVGMLLLDVGRGRLNILHLNTTAAGLLSPDPDRPLETTDLVGLAWSDWLVPADRELVTAELGHLLDGLATGWRGEVRMEVGGRLRWMQVSVAPLHPGATGEDKLTAQMIDVTDRRVAEDRLNELALHDTLTGLPNRLLLVDRLSQAIATQAREGAGVALLFLDLDGFKAVNDGWGHDAGDRVLIEVASRIAELVRPGDTVARLGGDEFVVLCPGAGPEVDALAGRLVSGLAPPVAVAGVLHRIGVSIGMAVGRVGSTPDSLLREADEAMYQAKHGGGGRVAHYRDAQVAKATRTSRLEADLERALALGQFRVALQPVVDVATGRWVAAEALARWQHPRRGLLAPADWLDVVEGSSMIHDLGAWVLEESCRLAMTWTEEVGSLAPAIHVNVSARQFDRGPLAPLVQSCLERTGLPGDRLVLELTETHLDQVRHSLRADLAELAGSGVRIAADDFGTGWSTLARITDLPVDVLKVDRRFVAEMLHDERARAVVQAVLGLGRGLGMEVVAEGVEDVVQARALRAMGCSTAQGYLWATPLTPAVFSQRLRQGASAAV